MSRRVLQNVISGVWALLLTLVLGCSLGIDTAPVALTQTGAQGVDQSIERDVEGQGLSDGGLSPSGGQRDAMSTGHLPETHRDMGLEEAPNDRGTETGGTETGGAQAGGAQAGGAQAGDPYLDPCQDPNALQQERCDGLDNDCDEVIDEDFSALGDMCSRGQGECLREGLYVCSAEGLSIRCDTEEVSGVEELCDQLDNDCDGVVDEELAGCCEVGVSRPCGLTLGVCVEGTQLCDDEQTWSACDGVNPQTETCDGADNDCDGAVDEQLLTACGTCDAPLAEVCDGQDNDCDGRLDEGVRNACDGCDAVPLESCDGADNDCDGQTDEGVLSACGTCTTPPSETCDLQDNDCDGRFDEGVPSQGVCNVGTGRCLRTGVMVCAEGRFSCNATMGPSSAESCNGVDDDCDGEVDEIASCVESCDGADNDLDGEVDEGLTNACGGCGAVPNEVCDAQDNDCDGSTDEQVLNTCMTCGPIPVEICDTSDNDCDGSIDEGITQLGQECSVGLGVCRVDGVYRCTSSGLTCLIDSPLPSATAESCNQLDDDCDGSVDEDFNLESDRLNCGACASVCPNSTTSQCVSSVCRCGSFLPCIRPIQACTGSGADAFCEELTCGGRLCH